MDRHTSNITTPEDFWTEWYVAQGVFAAVGLADGAQRSGVAALALLVWDILTTLDEEVNLIWSCVRVLRSCALSKCVFRSVWSLPKALYLFVRYYSLTTLIFHNVHVTPCVAWLMFEILSTFLVELAVEVMMVLRIYVIYGGQRKVLRIMQLGFALQFTLMVISLGVSVPKIMAGFYCKVADLSAEMVLYSTASIVYETFLFCMLIVGVTRKTKESFGDRTLLNVIVRDGIMAFVGVFLVMLLNTVLFTSAPTTLVTVGLPWLLAIFGAAGSRLVVNLRIKHAYQLTPTCTALTDLQFTFPSDGLRQSYAPVRLDDVDSMLALHAPQDNDNDDNLQSDSDSNSEPHSDREDAALNPSRNPKGTKSRRVRELSDVESQTPPPPPSPRWKPHTRS